MSAKTTKALVAALVVAGSLGSVPVAQAQSQIGNGIPAEVYDQVSAPSQADAPDDHHPKAGAYR
jgi:hypothetical protein